MTLTEYLQTIKPGDTVYVDGCGMSHTETRRLTVDKVTKTLIACGPYRYRRKDGWQPGEWARQQIVLPDVGKQEWERCQHWEKVRALRGEINHAASVRSVTLDQLTRALAILKENAATPQENSDE